MDVRHPHSLEGFRAVLANDELLVFALKLTSSALEAEEVLQRARLRVLERLITSKRGPIKNMRAFFRKVIANEWVTMLREASRAMPFSAVTEDDDRDDRLFSSRGLPFDEWSGASASARLSYRPHLPSSDMPLDPIDIQRKLPQINEALSRMNPDQRRTFTLRVYGAFSYREIAEMMGCDEHTAQSRMVRARSFLRTALTGEE